MARRADIQFLPVTSITSQPQSKNMALGLFSFKATIYSFDSQMPANILDNGYRNLPLFSI